MGGRSREVRNRASMVEESGLDVGACHGHIIILLCKDIVSARMAFRNPREVRTLYLPRIGSWRGEPRVLDDIF